MARKLNKEQITKAADKYIRDGKVEKAIVEYEKWLAANPKDWNTIRQIGDLYHRIGRNAEAIKKYTQIAEYYKTDGFNVRAIATFKMILRLDPQNEVAMASLAELQVAQGLLMEAKAQYQTLVEVYSKSGQKKRAAEVFKKLAEIDPADLKVRYKYAEFLDKQGQMTEAVEEYVGIADEFINKGLVPEAIHIMEKGLRIDSANRALRCKLAHAYGLQGDYAKAIQILSEIQSRYADDVELLTRLGEAYMGAGSAEDAEKIFRRLAELEPANPEHTSRRAEVAIGQGHHDQALEFLTPVIDRFVANSEGDKASALLQKVLGRNPHHVKTLVKLSEIYTILKNEQARLSAYDQLCEAYSHHGDYEKAARVAEQLVDLEPENSQHRDRLRFLKSRLAPPVEQKAAPAPAPAPTPAPAPVAPPEMELEIPGLESVDVTDELGGSEAELSGGDLSFEEDLRLASGTPMPDDVGGPTTLSAEDEEHIKEKLTEAEVFVRYGLVDKAVDQLKDVLKSFRFHIESREKLIEVYKEQGMNREASEEIVVLARIYERRGDSETAESLLEEARELNPALSGVEVTSGVEAEQEVELALTTEDLETVGLEEDLVAGPEAAGFEGEAPLPEGDFGAHDLEVEEEFPISDEEEVVSVGRPLGSPDEDADREVDAAFDEPEELPVDVELDAIAEPARGDVTAMEDLSEIAVEDEFPVVGEEDLADVTDLAFSREAEEVLDEVPIEPGMVEEPEIDLRLPTTDGPESQGLQDEVAIADGDGLSSALDEEVEPASFEEESEEVSIDLPDEEESVAAEEDIAEFEIPEAAPGSEPIGEFEIPEAAAEPEPMAEFEIPETPSVSRPAAEPAGMPAGQGIPGSAVSAELQEVDEYIALGLYEDARDTLRELLKRNPGDPSILGKIEELGFPVAQLQKEATGTLTERERAEVPPRSRPPAVEDLGAPAHEEEPLAGFGEPERREPAAHVGAGSAPEPFLDLASELSQEMFGTQSAVGEEYSAGQPAEALSDPGLDEIFREFKKGVEKQLGSEDYDTRYNLGIAYKEMGLLDEAIAEFQLAAKDDARLLECCSMLGLCFLEKGMPDIAIKWFEKGLGAPGRSEEEYHGLRYDLAQAHEAAGNTERALELYMDIYRVNARFRDVKDRVRELQAAKN